MTTSPTSKLHPPKTIESTFTSYSCGSWLVCSGYVLWLLPLFTDLLHRTFKAAPGVSSVVYPQRWLDVLVSFAKLRRTKPRMREHAPYHDGALQVIAEPLDSR